MANTKKSKAKRPALFVYMPAEELTKLDAVAGRSGGIARRTVNFSEWIREALRFATEHEETIGRRLRLYKSA
jgi:hypothetical protein